MLGTGYGFVQAGLDRQTLLAIPLWMVLILPFAKILATSLSIGSGGSGGIFGPGMFIGGMLGAGIWRLLEPIAPAIPVDPAPFVIVAMMALFGSVAHAPLAVMLMVAEMTGNLSMLAPAMVAVGLATFVVGSKSIYRSQLATRADSPAHRFRFAMPLLAAVPVGDAVRQARVVVRADDTVATARARMEAIGVPGAPVVGADGTVQGVIDLASLQLLPDHEQVGSSTIVREPILAADDGLDDALGSLADHHREWAPVVSGGRLVGILSVRDAMTAYRTALNGNIRQVRGLRAGGVIVETQIAGGFDARRATRVRRRVAAGGRPRGNRAGRERSSCRAETSGCWPATTSPSSRRRRPSRRSTTCLTRLASDLDLGPATARSGPWQPPTGRSEPHHRPWRGEGRRLVLKLEGRVTVVRDAANLNPSGYRSQDSSWSRLFFEERPSCRSS